MKNTKDEHQIPLEVLFKGTDHYNVKEKDVQISKRYVKIGVRAFKDNRYMEYLYIPNSIKEIENEAFMDCTTLKEVKFQMQGQVDIVPSRCFMGCKELSKIELPNINHIMAEAFCDCTHIDEITIPDTVIGIDPSAFNGWNHNQTIKMAMMYPLSNECNANVVIHDNTKLCVDEEHIMIHPAGLKMYSVSCQCGHVGRPNYMPITFPILAKSKKEAAEIARNKKRVKHHHKYAIQSVNQISLKDYNNLVAEQKEDKYLQIHSKSEQKKISDEIKKRILPDTGTPGGRKISR